jgi:hypothetical protein
VIVGATCGFELRPFAPWGASVGCTGVAEEVEHLANGALTAGRLGERQVMLNLVTVSASIAFFHDVAGVREVGDDAMRGAFGDAESCRDVAEADPGVLRDA